MLGAITIDVDTLNSLFKTNRFGNLDFKIGLKNFSVLLRKYRIKATLFVVGKDLENKENRKIIKKFAKQGHEIANHTYNHIQGFNYLSKKQKKEEIKAAEDLIFDSIGKKPVGFRAPGWNIDEDTLNILEKRGYVYDSSIFPSYFNLVFKLLNYISNLKEDYKNRTTMGKLSYMFYPIKPHKIGKRLVEIPITVTPFLKIPFFGTFTHTAGLNIFKISFNFIKYFKLPINYEFHLVEFIGFRKEFIRKIPRNVYKPPTLFIPKKNKIWMANKILQTFTNYYKLITLKDLAKEWYL